MDSQGVWAQKGTGHKEGLFERTENERQAVLPQKTSKISLLYSYLLFGEGLMLKFHTPMHSKLLNELLFVKHLE